MPMLFIGLMWVMLFCWVFLIHLSMLSNKLESIECMFLYFLDSTVWPDKLGILSGDERFPLPGLTGAGENLIPENSSKAVFPQPVPLPDLLTAPLAHERQASVISQIFNPDQVDFLLTFSMLRNTL